MKRAWMGVFALGLAGCGLLGHPDDGPGDGPTANVVRFTLDGQPVEILEELAFAIHDETRDLMGPFTEHYLEAGSPATVPGQVLGTKLQINLPEGIQPGTYRLGYALLPSAKGPWVRLRTSRVVYWTAYEGELRVLEAGTVGGRLRVSFDQLLLTNECGEERVLTAGEIDVAVGAETVFPESEIDLIELVPDAIPEIGNALTAIVDGRRWVCSGIDLWLQTYPASETSSGSPEDAVEALGSCSCTLSVEQAGRHNFIFTLPQGAAGEVEVPFENPYAAMWLIDPTPPFNSGSVDPYFGTSALSMHYLGPLDGQDAKTDIELTQPFEAVFWDSAAGAPDWSRVLNITELRITGTVERDCRPGKCQ